MNDTIVTIRGWVGGAPRFFPPDNTNGRGPATMFNVGVTPRFYNRARGKFQAGTTTWYSVRCFGNLAVNAAHSIAKGNPVIVRGRLSSRTWVDKDGAVRTSIDIVADSVGVEISSGIATYARIMTTSLDEALGQQWRTEPQAERTDEEGQGTDVASTEGENGLNDTSQDDVSELDELEDELAKEFAEEEAEELMAV
ncbi:single-stranded DNA-binding protein [Trueperella pyogenes]|uniref:single-stranded DNA-binding protein n=1 Tax=Trueperella pyogenes TaxID=1661 RepID=UPI00345DB3BF